MRVRRVLLTLLICFLTLYAPIELTRVIVAWGLQGQFIGEVCLMWTMYITAMVVVYMRIRKKQNRRTKGNESCIMVYEQCVRG